MGKCVVPLRHFATEVHVVDSPHRKLHKQFAIKEKAAQRQKQRGQNLKIEKHKGYERTFSEAGFMYEVRMTAGISLGENTFWRIPTAAVASE